MKLRIDRKDVKAIVIFVLMITGALLFSWLITCGIIKLISLCFGWKFKWGIATGIWLITLIARGILKND